MSLLQSKKKKRGNVPHFGSLGEVLSLPKLPLPPVNRRGAVWPRGIEPSSDWWGKRGSLILLAGFLHGAFRLKAGLRAGPLRPRPGAFG